MPACVFCFIPLRHGLSLDPELAIFQLGWGGQVSLIHSSGVTGGGGHTWIHES